MEIGGGQNIYNFGYYGLYNPLYLLSYLLPFVDMAVYVQGMMLATWIADGLLCYLWLLREDFREEESFFCFSHHDHGGAGRIPYLHADYVCQLSAIPPADADRI